MKSIKKRKLIPFLGFLLFGLLNIFNLSTGIAIQMQGESVTFVPDDDNPTQYGVFIPEPNMYTGLSIDALNQGEFTIMDWKGGEVSNATIDVPGENLTWVYPWYFDDYKMDSTTDNNYIDPWTDISWLNVTTSNPYNNTLSNYTINSIFDYHTMKENDELRLPINQTLPMQIDLLISTTGPKILKIDSLIDDPDFNPINNLAIISPLNKKVDSNLYSASYQALGSDIIFRYIPFIAHEKGTYKLLISAENPSSPGFLNLEFADFKVTDLTGDDFIITGDGDEYPSELEQMEDEWDAEWYRIEGNKGDMYTLDIGFDYTQASTSPLFGLYSPGRWGYDANFFIGANTFDIYFTRSAYFYVSITDLDTGNGEYRTSLSLREITELDINIGDHVNMKVLNDEKVALNFTIEDNSFVRFNYTQYGAGNAFISSFGVDQGIIFEDAKKLDGYELIEPLEIKYVNDRYFYYYYFPKGDYEAIIKNADITSNSIFQIDSKFVSVYNDTIPINSLNYLNLNPTEFLSFALNQNDYYDELYDARYVYINITEPGQYILNTTIDSSSLIASPRTPSFVVYHNETEGIDYDKTLEASAQDNQNISVFTQAGGALYIAYPHKWFNMEFNFSQLGINLGVNIRYFVWVDPVFSSIMSISDTTNDFASNGTIIFDITDPDYEDWVKGCDDFDMPNINEDDYYWVQIDSDDPYDNPLDTIPIIDTIEISNFTLNIDLNLALVGDSGYQYGDFWEPPLGAEPAFIFINESILTEDTYLFKTEKPFINFFENGLYKLLVIPHGWVDGLPITVNFAIENYWSYRAESRYDIRNITTTPDLYKYQINNYMASGYAHDDGTLYEYGLIASYGRYRRIPARIGSNSYYALECLAEPYKWTQLVVSSVNVSDYNLYLVHNLPWISNNGPNNEIIKLGNSTVDTTYEFGVFSSKFYLIFEVANDTGPAVTFRLDLNQYDTLGLLTSAPITSYSSTGSGLVFTLILVIVIPAAVGAVVVVYILKRKGRILTKRP